MLGADAVPADWPVPTCRLSVPVDKPARSSPVDLDPVARFSVLQCFTFQYQKDHLRLVWHTWTWTTDHEFLPTWSWLWELHHCPEIRCSSPEETPLEIQLSNLTRMPG